jgi:NAD(P)-dependent dehydrogenase (short-subunit alcohol dehydrogenase family)
MRPSRSWGCYVPGRGIWAGDVMRWRMVLEVVGADGTRQVHEVGAGERSPPEHSAATRSADRAAGGGAIVNVSSLAGVVGLSGSPGAVAYTTTKAGLQGFTLSIAADYAEAGIRANCLIVGTVNTPMVARLGEEAPERRRKAVPLRTEGTAWDVAHAAVYLASDEARWVTGAMLPIGGGFLAVRQWPR